MARSYKRTAVSFFQREDDAFDLFFKPFSRQKLNADLSELTNVDEFQADAEDVFEFDSELLQTFPAIASVLSFSGKLATSIILSEQWLWALSSTIEEVHTTPNLRVKLCSDNDKARIRSLVRGGFKVCIDPEAEETGFGAYDRSKFGDALRQMTLTRSFLTVINDCALSSRFSAEEMKANLRKYCVVLAVTFANECGAHALHSMIRPDFFYSIPSSHQATSSTATSISYKSNASGEQITPVRPAQGLLVQTNDFGKMVAQTYFFGAIPSILSSGGPFIFGDLILKFEACAYRVVIPVVESVNFQQVTYESEGVGLLGAEVERERPNAEQRLLDLLEEQTGGPRKKEGGETNDPAGNISAENAARSLDAELLGRAVVDENEVLSGCGASDHLKRR